MNKYLYYLCTLFFLMTLSCEKESLIPYSNIISEKNSTMMGINGQFKKEIIVYDENKQNQAFYAIYSHDEKILKDFLESFEFMLKTNLNENDDVFKENIFNEAVNENIDFYDLSQDPKIIIDLVMVNIKENVKSYSLQVNKKNDLKSASNYILGYPIGYTTSNNFIGIVHRGFGPEFLIKYRYTTSWLAGWNDYYINGVNAWFIYPAGVYYSSLGESFNSYKRSIIIYPHLYYNDINYTIAYQRENFRGQFCTIGSYDTQNCYVGTPPSGTTAFIYLNHFYYSPVYTVFGPTCPLPGSAFDGSNCWMMTIPDNCSPFIWANNWYVKTDIIND